MFISHLEASEHLTLDIVFNYRDLDQYLPHIFHMVDDFWKHTDHPSAGQPRRQEVSSAQSFDTNEIGFAQRVVLAEIVVPEPFAAI